MSEESHLEPRRAMTQLEELIAGCRKCDLTYTRIQTVPGEGPVPAQILLIGEAPGKQEDRQGRPFVGRAGQILAGLLSSIGINREEVFITSIVKCRPPKNRDPTKEQISACRPYLMRQIDLLRPRIIVPMGRFATSAILDLFGIPYESFQSVRGKVFAVQEQDTEILIVPVYHPAVVTHNPNTSADLRRDFDVLGRILNKHD